MFGINRTEFNNLAVSLRTALETKGDRLEIHEKLIDRLFTKLEKLEKLEERVGKIERLLRAEDKQREEDAVWSLSIEERLLRIERAMLAIAEAALPPVGGLPLDPPEAGGDP